MAAIRQELGRQSKDLAGLLELARAVDLGISDHHPLATAFMVLDSVAASASATLPTGAIQPFGVTWKGLIEQEDRTAALGCYRAAAMLALKRALRNGSVSVGHSIAYRQREERLIPHDLWERDRARFVRDLGLPRSCETFLRRLEAALSAGLEAVAEAVADGLGVPEWWYWSSLNRRRPCRKLARSVWTWRSEYFKHTERMRPARWYSESCGASFGKTPMQTFLDALPLAKEKLMAA